MANLKETSVWEPTISQLETSDPVMGGENGVSNTAPRQITNRTLWLKNALADAVENITTLGTTKADKATSLSGYGITDGATKTEVNAKADKATTLSGYGITDGATKTEVNAKAAKATTLSGYGITDGATKTEVNAKADKATTLAGYGITDAVNAPTVSTQTDINNYQTNGTFMTPATGLTNLPAGWSQGRYFVDVTKTVGSSYIRQSITNTTSNQTASRVWSGTSWTEWAINTSNSMFVGVLDESGYCTLPNGLIMQWGKTKVVSSGTNVTLPIQFPNKAVAVAAGISSANAPTEALYAYALTASQIIIDMSGPNTAVATWIAYGY